MLQDLIWFVRVTLRSSPAFHELARRHEWRALAKELAPLLIHFNVQQAANLEHWLHEHADAWQLLEASALDIPAVLHEILEPKEHP